MAPLKRPPSQRSRPTTKHAHRSNRRRYAPTAIGVALIAIVMIALQQRLASRSSSPGVSLVKRQRAPTPIHTEADLLRLEALLAAQPLNPDIPKAIRALKLDLFQQWLRAHDDTTIRLDSRSIDGKGVYAARRLGAGRPVLHIPLDRILTTDAIRRTPIGERLRDLNPSVHVLIGTYIALHRRNTSFELYPYLRILPEALDFMAVLANGTALEALRGTSADEIVVQRKNEIDDEWIRVAPAFPTLDGADFLWGVLVSMTRATAIVVNGVRTAGLVPLLNEFRPAHPTQATTTAKIINGYYLITTTKGVGAGDELTRHYGTRSAQMFYSDYAHVPPIITSSDSIRLRFAPIAPVADRIGDVIGTWPRNFLLTSDLDTPSMRQCLAFLRLRVATDPEWIKAQAMTDDLAHIAFIDDDNERRAVQALSSAIQSMIDALRCSAPATLPPNASASYQFAVKQARLMCSIERQLASIILESLPQLPKLAPSSSSAKTALIESGDAFADARQWLIRGGANLSAVDVVSFGDSYRGLVVNRDVSKEELVMVVPVSLCITSITARRTALALEAARNNVTLTPHALMAAMIVDESRKPDSPWRLFLRTLPPSYDNFLIYYTDEEIALLKGTRTLSQFRPFVNEINEDFELVQRAAPIAAASLTFDEYRRARHAVDSRNFIFQPDEDMPKDHIMVPYVDLMNHGVVANTAWRFDAHTASFHVQASATIGAGEALVTSYGDKSNAQLLVGYGFALPDNPYDKTTLRLDAESMCVVQKTFNTIEMADCFLKLRKRFTSEVELLQKMHDGAKKGLSRFKESIDEDQKWADRLLKEPDTGNDHVKFCVLTRLGEKLVLKFWIDATDTLLKYYSGEIARNELDPMYEQYFKVLENPEQHGSKARGKPNSENAEKEIVDSQ